MSPKIVASNFICSASRCVDGPPQLWDEVFDLRSDSCHAAHLITMLAIDNPIIKPDADYIEAKSQEIVALSKDIMVTVDKIRDIRNEMHAAINGLRKQLEVKDDTN